MFSRRQLLILAGCAAIAQPHVWAAEKVPAMLDHLLLGCSDLDQGIAFVERRTGVRLALGGVHPGRGTRNALMSLGPLHYLEVIAPDPAQTGALTSRAELPATLRRLAAPTLVTWAVHTSDIVGVAERWRKAGVAFDGPTPGSRARPDGRTLHWQTLNLANGRDGLLPFFIQWGSDTVHPSVDAPAGCRLESFAVASPMPGELSAELQRLGIDVLVERASSPHLHARIAGASGTLELNP
ncbi:MAG TPA: VOC family protein [Candidatus Eisenbacteria bacterium]|nr:VOC family protein [Candidatus Eisenbacteria bacterium]